MIKITEWVYKTITVSGYTRTKPKKKYVKPYPRRQRFAKYPKQKKPKSMRLSTLQKKEKDWAHLSLKYPNVIGLTDKEVDDYVNSHKEEERPSVKHYIKFIRAFNPDDIREVSQEVYADFNSEMLQFNKDNFDAVENKNAYKPDRTLYVTSPRGGFEILSQFSYANYQDIKKKNMGYDLSEGNTQHYGKGEYDTYPTVVSDSLPYGYKISDVNDIVFVDDIFMSGEQSERAYQELVDKTKTILDKNKNQMPRLHYIAIAGNIDQEDTQRAQVWNQHYVKGSSFRIGKKFKFSIYDENVPEKERASAIVFPFSIPDGSRHRKARELYHKGGKFKHRAI